MRRSIVAAFIALGCGGSPNKPAPASPPPPRAKTVPTPTAVCKRVATLSKDKFSDEDLKRCAEKMEAMRSEDASTYECIAACMESSQSEAEAEPCLKACVPAESLASKGTDGEGFRNLGSIEIGSKNMFQQETDTSGTGNGPFVHRFCPSTKQPIPAELPPAGEKVVVDPKLWSDPAWTCLKFAMNEPQYFQYSYENNGKDGPDAGYIATARRRLPNGKIRTFRLVGSGSSTGDAVRLGLTEKDE